MKGKIKMARRIARDSGAVPAQPEGYGWGDFRVVGARFLSFFRAPRAKSLI